MTRQHVSKGQFVARGAELGMYCIQRAASCSPDPDLLLPGCDPAPKERLFLLQSSLPKDRHPPDLISAARQAGASYLLPQ